SRHLDPDRARDCYELAACRVHRGAGEALAAFALQRPTHRDALVARLYRAANRAGELTEHDRRALARRPQCETAGTIERRPQEFVRSRRAERFVRDPRRRHDLPVRHFTRKASQAIARFAIRAADEAVRERVRIEAVIVLRAFG